jgi:hypothetical protein
LLLKYPLLTAKLKIAFCSDLWHKKHDHEHRSASKTGTDSSATLAATSAQHITTVGAVDLPLIMGRMGHLLLAIKDVFDRRSTRAGQMTIDGCVGT